MVHGTCYKCGREVPPENDMRHLLSLMGTGGLFGPNSCHLVATDVCPGSPSRAQNIKGQPEDPRHAYPRQPDLQAEYQIAWEIMQLGPEEIDRQVRRRWDDLPIELRRKMIERWELLFED